MKKRAMTIEDLAVITSKGFTSVSERLNSIETDLSNQIETLDENIKSTRRDVLDIGDRFVPRYEFDNLLIRFNRLEEKLKSKKA